MFERRYYVLRSFSLGNGDDTAALINDAVAECDCDRAAAAVACMTTNGSTLHVLIEAWRDIGDAEQDPEGAVDEAAAVGKPRRPRKTKKNNTGAAEGVEPQGVDLTLESAEVTAKVTG